MASPNKLSFIQMWLRLHRRHLPLLLTIGLIFLGFDCLVYSLTGDFANWKFGLNELAALGDVTVLPLAAINGIFLAQRAFSQQIQGGWKMIILKLGATVVSVLLVSFLLESTYTSLGYEDDDFLVLGTHTFSSANTNTIQNTFAALVMGMPIFIWQLRVEELNDELKEKEIEQERLVQLKTQAELHALQSRINPHFLFNSFNSIASLISIDAQRAENMMVQLSDLFRYSLNSEASNFVSIAEELKIVETYLSIEQVRFGENLDYEIKVHPALFEQQIPRFLIQPLVENAVKHAISKIKQGELLLEIKTCEEGIVISVFDNGPSFPEPLVPGYGLQSTYDKLNLLYHNQHKIEFVNGFEKQVRITLKPPYPDDQKV